MTVRPVLRQRLWNGLGVGALLLLWQYLSTVLHPVILPRPSATLGALVDLLFSGSFLLDVVLPSLTRAVSGLCLALAIGCSAGALAGYSQTVEAVLAPLKHLLLGLPASILIVLLILWLNGGNRLVICAVTVMLVPLFYLALLDGVRGLDRSLGEMAQVFRIPLWRRLTRIYSPALWHALRPALRLAIATSLRVTLLTEVLAGSDGLGQTVLFAQTYLETERLFALVLLILALIVGIERLFNLLLRIGRSS